MKRSSRTIREVKFKRAVSRAITKSKATTRALSRLLVYDIPRGPKAPRSLTIGSSTAGDIKFLLEYYLIKGNPANDHVKGNAARIARLLDKKLGFVNHGEE